MRTLNTLWSYLVGSILAVGMAVVPATGVAQGISPFGEATAVAELPTAWELTETRDISVDGMPVALSPDGRWIAGVGPNLEICVWEVERLTPTCAAPGDYRPNTEAIDWSPDSSAVAFTEDAARLLMDSDLYVFEVASGTLTNLTDDGYAGGLIAMAHDQPPDETVVDLGPTWSADSQSIAVGRMFWLSEDNGSRRPEIVRVPRTGGEPEVLATLRSDNPFGVVFPMIELADGTLVFTMSSGDSSNPNLGIWMLAPGGEPVQIVSGTGHDEFPFAQALDATDTPGGVLISGWSMAMASEGMGLDPYAFLVNADTGELDTLEPGMTPLRFGPDGLSTIALVVEGNDGMLTITAPNGDVSSVGPVPRSRFEQTRGLDWASNNTVFIASGVSSGQLVTLAPLET